jgi:hypothetical protein
MNGRLGHLGKTEIPAWNTRLADIAPLDGSTKPAGITGRLAYSRRDHKNALNSSGGGATAPINLIRSVPSEHDPQGLGRSEAGLEHLKKALSLEGTAHAVAKSLEEWRGKDW